MKLKITSVLFFLIALGINSYAQSNNCPDNPSYIPLPSQDCVGAIPLCKLSTTYATGQICGEGAIPNEIPTGSCLSTDERNTTWYVFKVRASGLLKFKIKPLDVSGNNSGAIDYDWAVFKLPAGQSNSVTTCAALNNNLSWQFSCNYSGQSGVTGMYDTTGTQQTDSQNGGGTKFNRPRQVNAGETFMLAVDNFTGDDALTGYTIYFADPITSGAGTADIVPPTDTITLQSIQQQPSCASNILTFSFARPVVCDSVTPSKFEILGANPPYTIISVSSANNCGGEGQSAVYNLTFTPAITDSTYKLVVRDDIKDICGNKVRFDTILFRIDPFLKPIIVSPDTTVCPGSSITLTADTTLAGTYTYIWKRDSVVVAGANKSSYSFIPDNNLRTKYTVIARLQSGCVDSASTYVRLADLPEFTMPSNDTVCFEGKNVKKTLTPLIEDVPGEILKYKWTSRNNRTRIIGTLPTFDAPLDTTDIYRLTITNEKGCVVSKSVTVFVGDSIVAQCATDTIAGAAPLPVNFKNLSEGQRVRYLWNFNDNSAPDSAKTSNGKDPYHVFRSVATNDTVYYFVTLKVSDTLAAIQQKLSLNGCSKTFTKVIKVVPFITPNVLTPNNDRKNDGFRFSGWSSEISLRVYNRWGKMVYENESYKNDWDANNLPSGTYFYYVEDKQLNIKLKGWVDVLGFKAN